MKSVVENGHHFGVCSLCSSIYTLQKTCQWCHLHYNSLRPVGHHVHIPIVSVCSCLLCTFLVFQDLSLCAESSPALIFRLSLCCRRSCRFSSSFFWSSTNRSSFRKAFVDWDFAFFSSFLGKQKINKKITQLLSHQWYSILQVVVKVVWKRYMWGSYFARLQNLFKRVSIVMRCHSCRLGKS